ncbi:restriction endonuclease subunit S [Vibrio vulnificus]|nr:restriction endonuclease subunit S [Vibrio vulnificus]
MGKVTSLQPILRFSGFNGDWSKKWLGSVCSIGDVDHWMPQTVSEGIPYLMTGDFVGINELDFANAKLISETDYGRLSRKIKPEYGDILFARYASVGAVRYVNTHHKFQISYSCAILKKPSNYDSQFLFYNIQSPEFQKKVELEINTGSQRNIGIDSLKKIEVFFPNNTVEQTQIGDFFQSLDQQIKLHQEKHNKLQQLKQAMLGKMFPKFGAKVPQVRFDGFNSDWEIKEFQSVFVNIRNNSLSRAELNDNTGIGMNVHYGDVLVKFGEILDFTLEKVPFITNGGAVEKMMPNRLQDGDVVIADAAEDITVGKCCEVNNLGDQLLFAGLHTIAVRPKKAFAPKYLGYFLNSNLYHDQLLTLIQGTKVSSISKSSIAETLIYYPKDTEEQAKIGEYFHKFDRLISFQQQRINKLKNIKRACLRKMFV